MSWTYSQSTGQLQHNGVVVGTGYSGAGTSPANGRNNSALQNVRDQGPIPQGQWRIGPAHSHPHKGPTVMRLTPVGHNAFDRSGFLIHGNNAANNASQGCIILGPAIRHQISSSGDTTLNVVP
jgi:type VI secretion system (T6SS) effector TldE1-like protein